MDIIDLRDYCLSKPFTDESFPFDENTLVFKTMGRIFALLSLKQSPHPTISLKCDPNFAMELREKYASVTPGYHLNKRLWNTIIIDGSVENQLIYKLIDHSLNEVIKKIPQKTQVEFMKRER